jgi:hypothetical protein
VSRHADHLLVRVASQEELHRLVAALPARAATLLSVTPARQSLEDLLLREVRRGGGERPPGEPPADEAETEEGTGRTEAPEGIAHAG